MDIKKFPPKALVGLHQEIGHIDSIGMNISLGLQCGRLLFEYKNEWWYIPIESLVGDVVKVIEEEKGMKLDG
jgi:hypothetical protein